MGEGVMASLGRGLKDEGVTGGGETGGVMAGVFGREREKGDGEEDSANRWDPPGSERERGRGVGWFSGGCWAIAWFGLGPGSAQLGWCPPLLLFFCVVSFLIFCFMSCFITLTFDTKCIQTSF
jgi:hypothetical protein